MKLTNYMRDAFIKRVMDDVPSIDYTEKVRAALVAFAVTLLPKKVKTLWDDKELRHWVVTEHISAASMSATIPFYEGSYEERVSRRKSISEAPEVQRLAALKHEQQKNRDDLERKLKGVAYSVTTRKALADALPEFEKYLPADEAAAIRTLPVVANVVSDFVKAGWPKGKTTKTAA